MPAVYVPYLRQVQAKLTIELHPSQAEDIAVGVHEHLNSLLMRYNEDFGGVVLSYTDVVLLSRKGRILTTLSPYIHLDLNAKLLVFAPAAQHVMVGSVNKVSPDHIGLLALGTFNGSIGADNIRGAFQYDHDDSAWVDRENAGSRIGVGTEVRFTVQRVHDEGSFLSFSGMLLSPQTGPLPSLKSLPEGLPPAREDKGDAAEATQASGKQRKRKAQERNGGLGVGTSVEADRREKPAGQIDEPEAMGKKKKKRREKEADAFVRTDGVTRVPQESIEIKSKEKRKSKH